MHHSLDPPFRQQLSCQQEWLLSPVIISDHSGATLSRCHWISVIQQDCFLKEIDAIKNHEVPALYYPSIQSLTTLVIYV